MKTEPLASTNEPASDNPAFEIVLETWGDSLFQLREHDSLIGSLSVAEDMYTIPMMFPLDFHGQIYVLQDETGKTIGTGTHQVCRVLLQIITKPPTSEVAADTELLVSHHRNVRAAITI